MPMDTKPDSVITQNKERLIKWSCMVTWQSLYLHYYNDYGYQTWQGDSSVIKNFSVESQNLLRSHEKLNALYLYYHKTSSHWIWQGGELL